MASASANPMDEKLEIPNEGNAATAEFGNLDDHENPKKWPMLRKWKAMLGISSFVLMSPLSSTIVGPSLPSIARDLSITSPAEQALVLSIFVLPYAFGPLLASPLSEIYGRVPVIQSWNFLYLVFNTACGAARSKSAMFAFRFLAGFFGSATLGIGGGTLGDLFTAEERDAVIQILGLYLLEETYAPVLLRKKQRRSIQLAAPNQQLRSSTKDTLKELPIRLKANLGRAVILLTTQPIVQVFAVYNAFLYGIIYILYTTFPDLYTNIYHQTEGMVGLHYIAMGIGMVIAAEGFTLVNDRIFAFLKAKNNGVPLPEFRVPFMAPATLLIAGGLFWYGWSAQHKLHWVMPDIGSGLFCAGAVICGVSANAYMIDTYGKFSASALAAVGALRSLTAFGFPLFAPYVFETIGYGWTGSLLGFCALGIGLPGVVLIWVYGKLLRRRSTLAAPDTR
ncbi:TPA_exp: putative MFS multidrug transporter [Trichophyton benhamiae CBS 112371]|nr:TPA_exp: putative MFS multidrug transporter [Trichophyton benhamiae CBS 112371]